MVDGEEPLQRERLRTEQPAGNGAVFFGGAVGGEGGAAAAFATLGEGGLGEVGGVVGGGVVGGEVGGEEEVGGVVGEGGGGVWWLVSGGGFLGTSGAGDWTNAFWRLREGWRGRLCRGGRLRSGTGFYFSRAVWRIRALRSGRRGRAG